MNQTDDKLSPQTEDLFQAMIDSISMPNTENSDYMIISTTNNNYNANTNVFKI